MANSHGYEAMTVKFLDHVTAKVSVKLIDGDGEDPADVYGHITGRFAIGNDIVFFDIEQHKHISVKPQEYIPLKVPEVRVPSEATNLEITAYLMDYDIFSFDDEIANGSVTFVVKDSGKCDTIPISGKYGLVEVTVCWG